MARINDWVETDRAECKGGTSLVAQWLRLCDPNAGGPGSVPVWETGSLVLHLKPSTAK